MGLAAAALKVRAEKQAKSGGKIEPRGWSAYELSQLRKLANLGAAVLARQLHRSRYSVIKAAQRNRISLRPEGETRGRLLGQGRSVSLMDDPKLSPIREKALSDSDYMRRLEEYASRDKRLAHGAELCRRCYGAPQEIEETELCRDCHKRRLAEAHLREEEDPARRELWRVRQDKSRRRRRGER